uniref:MADF domain-containing protein n=1 Tax=Bactrocera dorsalis TaxID=27457 RepID=A0A034W6T3_BACDO
MGSNACSTKQRPEHDKPKGKAYTDIKNKKTFKADKKLCNLVEQHPQLYDKGHKGYGQKKATDEAWRTIADSLGKSVSQCKARWEKLRAEYMAYLRSLEADKEQRGRKGQFKETAVAAENKELYNKHFFEILRCYMQDMTQREQSLCHISMLQAVHEISAMKQASGDGIDCIQNEIKYLVDKIDEPGLRTLQEIIQKRLNRSNKADMFSISKPQLVNDEVTIKN